MIEATDGQNGMMSEVVRQVGDLGCPRPRLGVAVLRDAVDDRPIEPGQFISHQPEGFLVLQPVGFIGPAPVVLQVVDSQLVEHFRVLAFVPVTADAAGGIVIPVHGARLAARCQVQAKLQALVVHVVDQGLQA